MSVSCSVKVTLKESMQHHPFWDFNLHLHAEPPTLGQEATLAFSQGLPLWYSATFEAQCESPQPELTRELRKSGSNYFGRNQIFTYTE